MRHPRRVENWAQVPVAAPFALVRQQLDYDPSKVVMKMQLLPRARFLNPLSTKASAAPSYGEDIGSIPVEGNFWPLSSVIERPASNGEAVGGIPTGATI